MTDLVRRTALAVGVGALTATALAGCGSHGQTYAAVAPPQAPLAVARQLTHPVTIGVVVTGSSAPGQGADDLGLAAGARVAQYRLDLAKAGAVRLDVVDDHGTAAGSTQAVTTLLHDKVAGIVYASEGSHLDAGVALAQRAHTAVLLPYDTTAPAGAGVWLTGPSTSQVVDVLSSVLGAASLPRPLVLRTEPVPGLDAVTTDAATATVTDDATLTAQVAHDAVRVGQPGGPDAVVLWGPAQAEADAVAALQQAGETVPVLLGPSALSPAFVGQLTTLGQQGSATTAGQYITAGVPTTDNSTGSAALGFFQGVRLAAADASVPSLVSTASFSADGAATADSRSHDAVLALVAAAVAAHSNAPQRVEDALATLTTSPSLGIAGAPLDFRHVDALASDSVVGLQATGQPSGQREGAAGTLPALTWFALGSAGS